MTRALAATLSLCAALAVAGGARAQKADAPAVASAPAAPAPAPASGVRASHRVDVIGPGERIETVIDRLRGGARSGTSAPVQAVVPADKLPLRAPDNKARGSDHPGGDAPRGPDGSHAPPGGGQPPDRPHR